MIEKCSGLLGRLKLIVCFASMPSYNFQDFGEKKTHTHFPSKWNRLVLFPWVCAVFSPLRIGFWKFFDAKHTINFKRPYGYKDYRDKSNKGIILKATKMLVLLVTMNSRSLAPTILPGDSDLCVTGKLMA